MEEFAILSTVKTLLVIFGITGDLSTRKLLPAICHIVGDENAPELEVLGVSRRDVDVTSLLRSSTEGDALVGITSVLTMDVAIVEEYQKLKSAIESSKADQVLIYLSVPPGAATQIVDMLGEAGINTANIRLLFEKPFGFDLESAKDFISRTSRYFEESQLYRIDHYMAKEVAAELLRLRRGAEAQHHHWGADSVESVTIVASEAIGIEGRAQFYEQTGALRDFIQGHLMQLLSLVLMTRPTLDESLSLQRYKALATLKPVQPETATRGQYEGYQDEVENPGSTIETFVSLELESDDENWKGVSLRLITGKSLDEKRSYIEIQHRDGWSDVFEEGTVIPENGRVLDAYERVLLEAIAGRKELFTSSDEVIRSWEILAPLQYAWEMSNDPIPLYKKGAHYTTVFKH
jgi:glucose-6-phosphate 1-dehydrogenase